MNINVMVLMQGRLATNLDVSYILYYHLNLRSAAEVDAVINEGIILVEDLANRAHDDIKSWADRKRSLPAKKLQGLAFGVMDMHETSWY